MNTLVLWAHGRAYHGEPFDDVNEAVYEARNLIGNGIGDYAIVDTHEGYRFTITRDDDMPSKTHTELTPPPNR